MSYSNLEEAIRDLEKSKQLLRIKEEVEPNLQMAAIHTRVFKGGGPAIFYEKVKSSKFSAVSNLFGTFERAKFLLRHGYKNVESLLKLTADPTTFIKNYRAIFSVIKAPPIKSFNKAILKNECRIIDLPQIKSWDKDGGPFITLPLVYSENPKNKNNIYKSNLGMYRIQMQKNKYETNKEIGLHYQINRTIGIHHSIALSKNEELPVSIFIGGPPALILSAVLPLPENVAEVVFSGMLANRNFRYNRINENLISTDSDFCITGKIISNKLLPEGPFGDHLGYYSLTHDFPVLKVEKVFHKKNAIFPFTVVGRPPMEDSIFGKIIHELTSPLVPKNIFGLKEMHAVDLAGVHPLMLAQSRGDTYTPYKKNKRPQELLTIANSILGFNQASLAKYLFIMAEEDNKNLNINNTELFFKHILERVNWNNDLHFQTSTTIDTLDYTGTNLNEGSKVVVAVVGEKKRELSNNLNHEDINKFAKISYLFNNLNVVTSGILAIQSTKKFTTYEEAKIEITSLSEFISNHYSTYSVYDDIKTNSLNQIFPLITIVDDSSYLKNNFNNWLWICFTRSSPALDIYGVEEKFVNKHWQCTGPLIIDARFKPHYPPIIETNPEIEKSVDELFYRNKIKY